MQSTRKCQLHRIYNSFSFVPTKYLLRLQLIKKDRWKRNPRTKASRMCTASRQSRFRQGESPHRRWRVKASSLQDLDNGQCRDSRRVERTPTNTNKSVKLEPVCSNRAQVVRTTKPPETAIARWLARVDEFREIHGTGA